MQTLRSLVLVACSLALVLPSTASQVGEAATEPCCRASDNPSQDTVCISAREMKSRITVVQALKPPCCSQHFDKSGIVYASVAFTPEGKVSAFRILKGEPFGSAALSAALPSWTFRGFGDARKGRPVCGPLVVRYHLSDHTTSVKLLSSLPADMH
jgi:hypothetical protein